MSMEGIAKLAAFVPVSALMPVMVAAEAEPFVTVTSTNAVLPVETNWKFEGFGLATTAVEPLPSDFGDEGILHYRALPLLGLPLGELFVLAPLAEDCLRDRRYEFMVVSAPMVLEGGIASPPNAVAIK